MFLLKGGAAMTKRILIIENNEFILELLADLLTRFGYCVEQAQSGREGLEKLFCNEFDAILLDLHLYDMDGKDIYQRMKERSPILARRIVFFTGDFANPDTALFIASTGNLCLQKPFTVKQLEILLEKLFPE
jgi:DNA-binding response OmpR family regulator